MLQEVSVPYFTKESMLQANDEAIAKGFNRCFAPSTLESALEAGVKYPIADVYEHDTHARLKIVFNAQGDEGWLDVTWEYLQKLPSLVCEIPTTIH